MIFHKTIDAAVAIVVGTKYDPSAANTSWVLIHNGHMRALEAPEGDMLSALAAERPGQVAELPAVG